MQDSEFIEGLMSFIHASPTPFHAVEQMVLILEDNDFKRLNESDAWQLEASTGKFYVTRNDSSIIAFTLGSDPVEHGFRMVGAHTDSPCLKVKPNPEITKNSYFQLGVEIYGGVLLNPWFDRDLSLAGRVNYVTPDGDVGSTLVNFEQAIATIPSLAIHLDSNANEERTVDKQKHMPPVLMKMPEGNGDNKPDFREVLLHLLSKRQPELKIEKVLDYELSFYDVQAPAVIGLHQDFVASARLDNLLSCYTELMAMLKADEKQNCLLVCNDHEEVGSMSAAGAQGPFLKSVLERLCATPENLTRSMDQSMMISVDNAHGIHPNYADKHDENHGPILNQGPVIKMNANQRYASNSETSAAFRYICEEADVPVQSFVVRSDMACGSTIGPITASELGVRTIDVGVPTFAMHSIRELAGRWDAYYLYRALREYFQ
ncbi:MAG: M18 family aminopeptidase [Gammaproteobacteria bacterium]|nr:M18 family aminopeptidase [Gammaproteobacteria bacterium]MCW8923459.1 M18 family aminopeptidase [Gammaproteobacteria bacterium]